MESYDQIVRKTLLEMYGLNENISYLSEYGLQFNSINEAVQWQKSLFEHIFLDEFGTRDYGGKRDQDKIRYFPYLILPNHFKYYTPVVPSMLKRLDTVLEMNACHALGPERLPDLIKIQGRKSKQISVFTSDEYDTIASSGLHGGGGLVAIVRGDVSVGMPGDIMSMVDKKGGRIIDLGPTPDFSGDRIDRGFYDSREYERMYADLKEMRAKILNRLKKEGKEANLSDDIRKETFGERMVVDQNSFTGKQKQQAIKDYIDGVESVLKKHLDTFQKLFFSHVKTQGTDWTKVKLEYDELVMGNFKIQKLYMVPLSGVESYFPKKGKYCRDPKKNEQCMEIDFPIEKVSLKELPARLEDEMKKSNIKPTE